MLFVLVWILAFGARADTQLFELGESPVVEAVLRTGNSSPGAAAASKSGPKKSVALLLGGFETGKAAITLIEPPEDLVLASMDYPFRIEGKWSASVILKRGMELRRALHAVDGVLCDFIVRLKSHPEIDPDRIVVVGVSFGVPYAISAASRCAPVRALILLQGFGDVSGTLASRIRPKVARMTGDLLAGPISSALGWIGWKLLNLRDPEREAVRVDPKIPVLWVEAKDDDLIPEASRAALREAFARHPEFETQVMPGAHIRPGNTKLIADLLERCEIWLRSKGILKTVEPSRGNARR